MTNATARYAPRQRHLHWLMALLVMAVYVAIEQRSMFEHGSPGRFAMVQSHFWLGLTLFTLVWWRLPQRLGNGAPPIRVKGCNFFDPDGILIEMNQLLK